MVKNLLCSAEDMGLIPGHRTKMPRAAGQPSPWGATTEPTQHSQELEHRNKDPKVHLRLTQPGAGAPQQGSQGAQAPCMYLLMESSQTLYKAGRG